MSLFVNIFRKAQRFAEWLPLKGVGKKVDETFFVPFKVPLYTLGAEYLDPPERFNFHDLFARHPDIGLIIDLSPSKKYYSPKIPIKRGIKYVKVSCQGRGILPRETEISRFIMVVDEFRKNSSLLVGVHCFHGLNRTGLMICLYMIRRLGFTGDTALEFFNKARGHEMTQESYINYLKSFTDPIRPISLSEFSEVPKSDNDYRQNSYRGYHHTPSQHRRNSYRNYYNNPSSKYRNYSRGYHNPPPHYRQRYQPSYSELPKTGPQQLPQAHSSTGWRVSLPSKSSRWDQLE